jgi:hypothetical protein
MHGMQDRWLVLAAVCGCARPPRWHGDHREPEPLHDALFLDRELVAMSPVEGHVRRRCLNEKNPTNIRHMMYLLKKQSLKTVYMHVR